VETPTTEAGSSPLQGLKVEEEAYYNDESKSN